MKKIFCMAAVLLAALTACGKTPPVTDTPEKETASYTEIQADGPSIVAYEDDAFVMSVDTNPLAVKLTDKKSREIWATNPGEPEKDEVASSNYADLMKAQLAFTYYKNQARQTMDSFSDCAEKGQYKLFRLEQGVRIEYTFGDFEITVDDIPHKLTKKRFDELILKNDVLIQAEKDTVSSCFEEKDGHYAWKQNVFGSKAANAAAVFGKIGYTAEDLRRDASDFGETVTANEKIGFMIPVEYTVEDGRFCAKIKAGEIVYPKDMPINTISFLEFFGAGKSDEEGYLFVPDGCGALIRFDKEVYAQPQLSLPVYSADKSVGKPVSQYTQPILLPVFGLKRGDSAFLAEITEGDALAGINATRAGSYSTYNSVFPSFTVTAQDSTDYGAQNKTLNINEASPHDGDLTVRYTFLYGEEANYASMAARYRESLSLPSTKNEQQPLYIEAIGAVKSNKSFFGINYDGMTVLTTGAQAEEIQSKYSFADVKLLFSGLYGGGYDQNILKNTKIEKGIGTLPDAYHTVRFLTAATDKGMKLSKEAAGTVGQNYARLYKEDFLTKRPLAAGYLISPDFLPKLVDGFLQSFSGDKLFLRDMGKDIYADYTKTRHSNRQKASETITEQLEKLSRYELLFDGITARTARFAGGAVNLPMDCSHYQINEEAVPFLQMVLHGHVDYAGAPLNLSPDFTGDVLKSIQFGASLYAVQTASPSSEIIKTSHSELYSTYYADWADRIQAAYEQARPVFLRTAGAYITGYEKISDNVYRTVFSNGESVTVNYGDTDYEGIPPKGVEMNEA